MKNSPILLSCSFFHPAESVAAISPPGSLSYLTIAIIICIVIVAIGAIIASINLYLARKLHKKMEEDTKKGQQPLSAQVTRSAGVQTTQPATAAQLPYAPQSQYAQPGEVLTPVAPQNVYAGDPFRTDPFGYNPLEADPLRENPMPTEQYQAQWGAPAPYPYPPQGTSPTRVCRYCGASVDERIPICTNCQNPMQ